MLMLSINVSFFLSVVAVVVDGLVAPGCGVICCPIV